MIVVGTAGHIDHGKSAIVKRLTGTDPDRLPEEKARGMTIDLGFAFYRTATDERLALVDVPGHERFVRNMIAGAGGIDAVLLVIAADDGWMPQSEEHFQITRLLGVRHGLIVINKIDLVESDWLEMLEDDIRARVAGSFLQAAPIMKVSAITGDGFDRLSEVLTDLASAVRQKKDIGKPRLYVDRSFVQPGIGGVVAGTLRGGCFSVGKSVTVWPSLSKGKIRTLQSNSEDVQRAEPGQRTALSLTGVDKELLSRGAVISDRLDLEDLVDSSVLALSVELVKTAPLPLDDRRRALIIVGTSEIEGEVRLFGADQIPPGGQAIIFFRPDQPIYALVGDYFILRLPTPMVTLGGGRILDHLTAFPRRKELAALAYLQDRCPPTPESVVKTELVKHLLVKRAGLLPYADYGEDEIALVVDTLLQQGSLGEFAGFLFDVKTIQDETARVSNILKQHFKDKPHLKGSKQDSIALMCGRSLTITGTLLEYMVDQKLLVREGDLFDIAGRRMSLKGIIKQVHDEIMAELQTNPHTPTRLSDLASGGKIHQQAIKYIIDTGEGYKCGSDFLFTVDAWNEIVLFVKSQLNATGQLTVSDLRDKFGCSRKFAIPILEEADRLGLTERKGDIRVKGSHFEKDTVS